MSQDKKVKLGISLYRIFSRAYFYLPFLVIFLYKKNFSILKIEIIMAIYGLSLFLFTFFCKKKIENYLSNKSMLIISELLKIVGLLLLINSIDFIHFVVAQFILGISYSIGAGNDSKIIREYIHDDGSFQAKSNSYMFNTLLISGLIGSWLFALNIHYPFYATCLAAILCISSSILCLEGGISTNSKKDVKNKTSNEPITPNENRFVLGYSFLRGIILTFFSGLLPFHLFVDLKVSILEFILILTSYTLVGSFSSKLLPKYVGEQQPLLISEVTLFISLITFYSNNIVLTAIGTILLGVSSGAIRPIVVNQLSNTTNNLSNLFDKMEIYYAMINISLLLIGGFLYQKLGFKTIPSLLIIVLFIYMVLVILNLKTKENYNASNSN